MMGISTRGRYSLRILIMMAAQPQGHMSTKQEIAKAEALPPAYIQQLMMTLRTSGFVASHRGRVGGFTLARAAESITVADVLRATEGPIVPAPCLGNETCEREPSCPARPMWMRAAQLLEEFFGGVTVADLVERGANGSPSVAGRV
jgi:Rrf2 family transcriptional regulator, iron-sulfur cluster assembly transcription factor